MASLPPAFQLIRNILLSSFQSVAVLCVYNQILGDVLSLVTCGEGWKTFSDT